MSRDSIQARMDAALEWRDMASAPRDGTRVLGWFGDRAIVVFWRSGPEYARGRATGKRISYWSDGYGRHREPDCWQPQPVPPDPALFPNREPPTKPPEEVPRSPTARERARVSSAAAQRPIGASAPWVRPTGRKPVSTRTELWCDQCERRVTPAEVASCTSRFCKVTARSA